MSESGVELVYFTGCPNADTARANIRGALREIGRSEHWSEWDLEDGATPEHYRSYGSPTVLVGGRDVAGGGVGVDTPAANTGLSCSADGAPSVEQIVRAFGAEE